MSIQLGCSKVHVRPHNLDSPQKKCSYEHVLNVLQIEQLRQQLREKFPAAHRTPVPAPTEEPAPAPLEFASGQLSEIISPHPSSGASLVLRELLDQKRDLPLALIDGNDSFDPASYGNSRCRNLIWLRCQDTREALHCADLLLGDGNLPLVLLDLHLVCERELRQTPSHLWHRLKIQARESGTTLVTLTPRPLVPTPHRRLTLAGRFSLEHLELTPPRLPLTPAADHRFAGKA